MGATLDPFYLEWCVHNHLLFGILVENWQGCCSRGWHQQSCQKHKWHKQSEKPLASNMGATTSVSVVLDDWKRSAEMWLMCSFEDSLSRPWSTYGLHEGQCCD
jgi:hypothetical protein